MLKQITEKSLNTFENQGSKSVESKSNADNSLFEQFSDILDKIATSLNRAKQRSNREQAITDLSASLSQVASQHAAVRPQMPERKLEQHPAGLEKKVAVEKSEEAAVKSEARPVPEATKSSEKKEANSEQPKQVATEKVASPAVEKADEKEAQLKVSEGCAAQTPQVVAASEEHVMTEEVVQVAEAHAETGEEAKVVVTEEAPVETVEVAQSNTEAVPSNAKTDLEKTVKAETPVQAQTTEKVKEKEPVQAATTPTEPTPEQTPEWLLMQSQHVVQEARASQAAEVTNTKQAQVAAELTNQQILAQSAQELLRQAFLVTPTKAAVEVTVMHKLSSSVQSVQSTQGNGNSQNMSNPMAQQARTPIAREKLLARELPRGVSLRTLERVESALKEVSRSKDGKTISLRLDPPSLGSVKIDVTFKDNNLHARVVAESAQVTALLRDHAQEMQQLLRNAGIEAESISVSIGSEHLGDSDLNSNFMSFEQQFPQQAAENFRGGKGVEGNGELNGDAQAAANRPLDHWVA